MIEEYKFGLIIVEGKKYTHDVEVRWILPEKNSLREQECEVLKWWRKEGHIFDLENIQRALDQKPDLIVFGTGAYGAAKVSERAKKEIENRDIQLIIDKTEEAVKTFNIILRESKKEIGKQKKVVGLFHLAC